MDSTKESPPTFICRITHLGVIRNTNNLSVVTPQRSRRTVLYPNTVSIFGSNLSLHTYPSLRYCKHFNLLQLAH